MKKSKVGTYKKKLLYLFYAFIALVLVFPFILGKYLTTTHAAAQISRMLSDSLGQPVVMKQVTISDGTLHLKGFSLANPDGFPLTKLLSVDSVIIKPVWLKLLSNSRTFEKITVEGITVDLRRNSAGIWNFDRLQRRFSSQKPSSAEVLIRQLKITNGTLQVNDQKIAGLALNLSEFATRGSDKSGFNLQFDDPGHNHYTLTGKARLGKDPELDVSLSSSAISLKNLPEIIKIKSSYLPENGNANLLLTADLRKGMIRSRGEINFNSAVVPATGRGGTFSGNLSLSAGYDLQKDYLAIENIALHLNRMLAVRVSGNVRELRLARHFAIDVAMDEIEIGNIVPLIPELARNKIIAGGRLEKSSLHLSGNASEGVKAASGKLGLTHGMLKQDKRLIFNDLGVVASVSAAGDSVTVAGKATHPKTEGDRILESLNAPFKITSNKHFKSVKVQAPSLSARAQGASFAGSLSYADGAGLMENVTVKAGDISVALGRLSALIPLKQASSTTVRYPLNADFSGCDIRRGDALLKKLSGNIRGTFASKPDLKWLEGAANLSVEKASWQGKESGAVTVHAVFSESGGKAEFKTSVLGGSVSGNAAFNPFALLEKVVFNISTKGIQLAGAMKYAGLKGDTTVSGGVLDADCNGSYSRSGGLICHVEARGGNIAVTGKGAKTLLSAGAIKVNSDLSGKKLVINEILLTAGKDVSAKASGAIDNFLLPDRQGRINFNVPKTSLASAADSFLNLLPRSIQEATIEGSISSEGTVNLQEGGIFVDGAVTLANISIDAPTENAKVTGINGVLPLSLDLAGKSAVKLPASSGFSRQNYDSLIAQLRQTVEKVNTITIDGCSFGGLSLGSIKLKLRAAKGVTGIVSLDSSVFGGALLGKGFITTQNGILYRGDMLFNDLSLVQLCNAFPAITGYMSGRIDGILSIQGKGKQLSGITGFTEFWARGTAAEKMLVSKEFLQRLSGKKLSGFFFSSDRAYDHAGIKAALENGFLTFDSLDISHTNVFGVRDLGVTIAPSQNRIALDHLLNSIKVATVRGKSAASPAGKDAPAAAPPATEFKWAE